MVLRRVGYSLNDPFKIEAMKRLDIIKITLLLAGMTFTSKVAAEVNDTITVSSTGKIPEWLFSNDRNTSTSAVTDSDVRMNVRFL